MWRVTWAHPEFGQVLATCSFDRTVAIWEEHGGWGILGIGPRGYGVCGLTYIIEQCMNGMSDWYNTSVKFYVQSSFYVWQ